MTPKARLKLSIATKRSALATLRKRRAAEKDKDARFTMLRIIEREQDAIADMVKRLKAL